MATPAYKKASYTMSHKRLEHHVLEIGSNLDLPKLELLGEHPTLHAGIVAEPLPCGELLAPNRSDSGPWAAWVSISNPSRSRTSRLLTLEYRQLSHKEEVAADTLLPFSTMAISSRSAGANSPVSTINITPPTPLEQPRDPT